MHGLPGVIRCIWGLFGKVLSQIQRFFADLVRSRVVTPRSPRGISWRSTREGARGPAVDRTGDSVIQPSDGHGVFCC